MPRSILVVDNDESILEFLGFFFEAKGFTVHVAVDGASALELALRHRPAVVICDMWLGDMDGIDVVRRIRSAPDLAKTSVIIASASSAAPDIERARELGAVDYIVKPFDAHELLAIVERHYEVGRPN